MKFLVLISTLCLSLSSLASTQAETTQVANPLVLSFQSISEVLRKVESDGNLVQNHVGLLKVDLKSKTIKVEIADDICGQYAPLEPNVVRCMAMPIRVTHFEVPLTKTSLSCGSRIYEGLEDSTPVDGPRVEIKVTDHSRRLCRDIVPSQLMVEIKVTNPWNGQVQSYLLRK